jgi:hypothetical protein
LDFNRPFGAILSAGTTVPALFRIFYEGFSFHLIHINYVQRTGIFTGAATSAKLFDNHRGH